MRKNLIFVCKRGRPRDIPLLREGAHAAGYRFMLALVPFAYPLLVLAAIARWAGADIAVIISDRFPGDRWLAHLLPGCVRMLWNYADEFPGCLASAPHTRVCFFEDPAHPVQLFRFAPQPRIRPLNLAPQRRIVFVGDVSLHCALPQGLEWWEDRLRALGQRHGFRFYLEPSYDELLASNLQDEHHLRQVKVLTKNLLRLWIVQSAHRAFASHLVLVGSNWRKFDLAAQPSAYSLEARLRLYESAAVNLDCGSKSGDSALYPRSSEVISYAGAPVQVACRDSAMVFGPRMDEFAFSDEASMLALLEARLSEPDAARLERAEWLACHLDRQRLTMADSFRQLFEAPWPDLRFVRAHEGARPGIRAGASDDPLR